MLCNNEIVHYTTNALIVSLLAIWFRCQDERELLSQPRKSQGDNVDLCSRRACTGSQSWDEGRNKVNQLWSSCKLINWIHLGWISIRKEERRKEKKKKWNGGCKDYTFYLPYLKSSLPFLSSSLPFRFFCYPAALPLNLTIDWMTACSSWAVVGEEMTNWLTDSESTDTKRASSRKNRVGRETH